MKNNLTILLLPMISVAKISQEYKAEIGQAACKCFKKVKTGHLRDESAETGKLAAAWILKECPDLFMEMYKP